jgi:MFS family permease
VKRFAAVWVGQLVSALGSGVTAFALAVWLYRTTGDVVDLALLAGAAYVPHVLVAPYGGVVADRFDRRLVMLAGDAGSALATAALLACSLADTLTPALAIALVGASACANAVQWPAYEAAIATLVAPAELARANGLVELARGAAQLLAPPLAGALYGVLGLPALLALDVASFAAALVPLLAVWFPPHARAGASVGSWLADLRVAWDFVTQRAGLVAMLVLFAITNFTFAVSELVFRPLVLATGDAWQLGVVLAMVGCGMVAGSLVLTWWGGPRRKLAAILGFQLVEGGALVAAGLATGMPARCVAAFAYGVVIPLTFGCARTIWQLAVPAGLQGRVAALRNAAILLAIPIGYAAGAPLASILGPARTLVAMGALTWTAAVATFALADYRRVEAAPA